MAEAQNPGGKEKRELVHDEIRAEVVEERYSKIVRMYNKVDQDQVRSMWNLAKSSGQSSGEPNHSTLMFSQAMQTCIAGAWQTLLSANCVRGGALWSTS